MYQPTAQSAPVEQAVEHVVLNDFYLEVGQVMTENMVHDLRCRVQHRDPETSDRLATFEALEKLMVAGNIQMVDMFGSRCIKRMA